MLRPGHIVHGVVPVSAWLGVSPGLLAFSNTLLNLKLTEESLQRLSEHGPKVCLKAQRVVVEELSDVFLKHGQRFRLYSLQFGKQMLPKSFCFNISV